MNLLLHKLKAMRGAPPAGHIIGSFKCQEPIKTTIFWRQKVIPKYIRPPMGGEQAVTWGSKSWDYCSC